MELGILLFARGALNQQGKPRGLGLGRERRERHGERHGDDQTS
jgi:hypothetical protein